MSNPNAHSNDVLAHVEASDQIPSISVVAVIVEGGAEEDACVCASEDGISTVAECV